MIGFPKPQRADRLKAERKEKREAKTKADAVREYVFGRERNICRCCRFRRAESRHELISRGRRGKISRMNCIAVCGTIVGAVPSCHTYLQLNQIEWRTDDDVKRAEATLAFEPTSKAAAEWMRIEVGTVLISPPMFEVEAAE